MADRRRKTVWKDTVVDNATLAATTIADTVILPETTIESLGDVTITRVVGELSLNFAVGATNTVKAAIWIAPAFGGATTPATWNADAFERQRIMWTMHRMMGVLDDTMLVHIDIRSKRKVTSGVDFILSLENTSANVLSFAFHMRVLAMLA